MTPLSLPRAELTGAATSGCDRAPNPGEPIARRAALFAEQRDALYAWSGQLELTAGAA